MTEEHDDHRRFQRTLDRILAQTSETNGRVTGLEHEVYGDPQTGRKGLVQQARDTAEVVQIVRTGIAWGKRLSVMFAGAIVVGLVNLAQQAL